MDNSTDFDVLQNTREDKFSKKCGFFICSTTRTKNHINIPPKMSQTTGAKKYSIFHCKSNNVLPPLFLLILYLNYTIPKKKKQEKRNLSVDLAEGHASVMTAETQ